MEKVVGVCDRDMMLHCTNLWSAFHCHFYCDSLYINTKGKISSIKYYDELYWVNDEFVVKVDTDRTLTGEVFCVSLKIRDHL